MARLQAVCRDNKMEENLNNLADDLDAKEYALSPGQSPHGKRSCLVVVLSNLLCCLFRVGWSPPTPLSLVTGDGHSDSVGDC